MTSTFVTKTNQHAQILTGSTKVRSLLQNHMCATEWMIRNAHFDLNSRRTYANKSMHYKSFQAHPSNSPFYPMLIVLKSKYLNHEPTYPFFFPRRGILGVSIIFF